MLGSTAAEAVMPAATTVAGKDAAAAKRRTQIAAQVPAKRAKKAVEAAGANTPTVADMKVDPMETEPAEVPQADALADAAPRRAAAGTSSHDSATKSGEPSSAPAAVAAGKRTKGVAAASGASGAADGAEAVTADEDAAVTTQSKRRAPARAATAATAATARPSRAAAQKAAAAAAPGSPASPVLAGGEGPSTAATPPPTAGTARKSVGGIAGKHILATSATAAPSSSAGAEPAAAAAAAPVEKQSKAAAAAGASNGKAKAGTAAAGKENATRQAKGKAAATTAAGKESAASDSTAAAGTARSKRSAAGAKAAASKAGLSSTTANAAATAEGGAGTSAGTRAAAANSGAKAATAKKAAKKKAAAPADHEQPEEPSRAAPYVFDQSSVGISKKPEDLLKVLEAAKKEFVPGEEPWRAYAGITVNEEPILDAELKMAVAACQKEYWRRYRLAVDSEDKRVVRVLAERAAAAAAAADGAADGAANAATASSESIEAEGDEEGDDGEAEEDEEAAAGAKTKKQKKGKQEKKGKKEKPLSKRPDRVAESSMVNGGVDGRPAAINRKKVFGHVPGIDINDRFIVRSEVLCVGLHPSPMAGISYAGPSDMMKMTGNTLNRSVAVSVVVAGNYEDDLDTQTTIIYTGEGGNNLLGNKRQVKGQELVRGNAALAGNYELGIPVRVLRKNEDATSAYGQVYLYDGLYDVVSMCQAVGNSSFIVWKYMLKRRAGQPESISKPIEFGGVTGVSKKAHVLSRPNIICTDLSKGLERLPVVVVNEVDRELPPGLDPEEDAQLLVNDKEGQPLVKAPYDMKYIVEYTYDTGISPPQPPTSCSHGSHPEAAGPSCRPPRQQQQQEEEPHEMVHRLNLGRLPYVQHKGANGIAVDTMSLIVECGDWTGCTEGEACLQRQVQHGLRYRLEVFKTAKCGWGVRSWDSIPAGAFVTGFYGHVIRYEDAGEGQYADDTYHFEMTRRTDLSDDHKWLTEHRTFEHKYIIDAKNQGGVARFINHSCRPNLYVQPVCAGHADDDMPGIALFAMQPIQPWDELTYDYGQHYLSTKLKGGCHCGAPECQHKPTEAAAGGDDADDADMAEAEVE